MKKSDYDETIKEQANSSVTEYKRRVNSNKDKRIENLLDELERLKKDHQAMQSSISYKIGRFVTLPIRFVVNLFSKKKVKENPIKTTCDGAFYSSGLIEVTGWALSDTLISKVELLLDDKLVCEASIGVFREDVMQAFPEIENSQFSGFTGVVKGGLHDQLSIVVSDSDGNCITHEPVIVPATEDMSLNAQYQIYNTQLSKPIFKIPFGYNPLISLIVPVYNVSPKWLNLCINSVMKQNYQNWQLCLYDDASTDNETLACLENWQNTDQRICIKFGTENKGIAFASNEAIKLAKGEFIGLLDHDDELSIDALFTVVDNLNHNRKLDFIYSDEDKIGEDGELCDPHFKSDFNQASLLSWNYICHFAVVRKYLGDEIGWFRKGFEGSQDYDLFLRLCAITDKIHHIPQVLYHWRKTEGSTAVSLTNKDYAIKSSHKALTGYLKSQNISARVKNGLFANSFQIVREINHSKKVSIIIPFKDGYDLTTGCLKSLLTKTDYTNFEIILVNNQSSDTHLLDFLENTVKEEQNVKLLHFDEIFNFSRLNNWVVNQVESELVLFLNNDIKVINSEWLNAMVNELETEKTVVVGAKLLYSDDTIQHAGVIVSSIGAMHINKGQAESDDVYFQRANYVQNISAVTAACMLVKRSAFLEVGGFDEELLAIAYNDVDLCLKLRQAGYLITYTPYAKLYHYESKSRGYDDQPDKIERFAQELKNYQQKWGEIYKDGDPYFNPNLKPNSEKICLNIK